MLRSLGLHASAGVPRRTAGRLAMRPSASASVPASPAVLNYNGEQVTVEDASLAPLFKGFTVGKHTISHGVVYAPLTRCRALGYVTQPAAAMYYSQRTSAGGLIISEGTVVSPTGHGYPSTPGLYTEEQVTAWKPVTAAVKAKGGVFYCQLWHVGGASHPDYQPGGADAVSSSGFQISDPAWKVYSLSANAEVPYPKPRALALAEIPGVVADWAAAARRAIAAGFDGVEVHGANGYLLSEFCSSNTNNRTDAYGGSVENRCRLTLEVVRGVVEAVGADRVGIRLSPYNVFLGVTDAEPPATFGYLIEELSKLNLAYLHLITARQFTAAEKDEATAVLKLRRKFKGTAILAGGFTPASAAATVAAGDADAIAFGRAFLSNPDLPKRIAMGAELTPYDRTTFYTQDQVVGYTDYPFMGETLAKGVPAVDPHSAKL